MVTKELRDAWWKFILGAVAVLVLAAFVVLPYGYMRSFAKAGNLSVEFGTATSYVIVPLAALLGVALISSEVGGNSIYLLLSKPVSRTRLLLIKYAIGAGALLAISFLGSVGVIVSAAVRGYPLEEFSVWGVGLSSLLMWLGSLCVLGVALLISVIFRDTLRSVFAVVPTLYLFFLIPGPLMDAVLQSLPEPPNRSFYNISLLPQWTSQSLYAGESLAPTNFLVCLLAAAVPLLAALWLFQRRAY